MAEKKIKRFNETTHKFVPWTSSYYSDGNYDLVTEIMSTYNTDMLIADFGYANSNYWIVNTKLAMHDYVFNWCKNNHFEFDPFNGKMPTRINMYSAYEFPALWFWSYMISMIVDNKFPNPNKTFYKNYAPIFKSVFAKYPKITGAIITSLDLVRPDNKFFGIVSEKCDDIDFDKDVTDDSFANNPKVEEFKNWVFKCCNSATEKDKMRVRNWFETKKSHKQIFAEINKVVGNSSKFNSRLALFVERLFNHSGVEYFFEKTGFDSKEELLMTYFDKLTMFDDETKRGLIKKYLV